MLLEQRFEVWGSGNCSQSGFFYCFRTHTYSFIYIHTYVHIYICVCVKICTYNTHAYFVCDRVLIGLLICLVECLDFLTAWCSEDETAI